MLYLYNYTIIQLCGDGKTMKQSEFKSVKIKPELHRRLKIQAVKEETSIYDIATKAFDRYLKKPDKPEGK